MQIYKRRIPQSAQDRIVTRKAKFFGQLMLAVLKAGGVPNWFRYEELRNRTVEGILDSLMPNDVHFSVEYKGKRK